MQEKEIIKQWKDASLMPSLSDVLLNLHPEKRDALFLQEAWKSVSEKFQIKDSVRLRRILKLARDFRREAGIESLGVSNQLIVFEFKGESYRAPIILKSVVAVFDKFNEVYKFEAIGEELINPFLVNLFEVDDNIASHEAFLEFLNEKTISYKVEEGIYLANFHPHRFAIIRELERVLESEKLPSNIAQILGNETNSTKISIDLHEGFLFPYNYNQLAIFEAVSTDNCVVQGPPGTGKSQVITNLIGKIIGKGASALIVSEKLVALNVIRTKMKEVGLEHFCLQLHHQLRSKDFIQSLKESWLFLEGQEDKKTHFTPYSSLLLQGLDLTLNRLKQPDLIGGVDFSTFVNTHKSLVHGEITTAEVPDLPQWQNDKKIMHQISAKEDRNATAWVNLRLELFQDQHEKFVIALDEVNHLIAQLNLKDASYADLSKRIQKSSLAHLFFYDETPIDEELLTVKKRQTSLLKLKRKLEITSKKIAILENEQLLWKDDLSISQMLDWIEVMKEQDRWSMRYWRTKRTVEKASNWNVKDTVTALERRIELKKLELEHAKIIEDLQNINAPTNLQELEQLQLIIQRIQASDASSLKELLALSIAARYALKKESSSLSRLKSLLNQLFYVNDNTLIGKLANTALEETPMILKNYGLYSQVSKLSKSVLSKTSSLDEAERLILTTHWFNFCARYPELSNLDEAELRKKIVSIIATQDEESCDFSKFIINQQAATFNRYQQLLQTPAVKLSATDKALKKRLKTGKSLLVKEFGKSRSHKSALELFQSDAELWIRVLKPVLLTSPFALAKAIPMHPELFDTVIFDEASQIPIYHALGGIFRSKRVVVAGDQQQMPPTFYFKRGVESMPMDLLHQASYYWKNHRLTHHYRSKHENLIAFSNRYFYGNNLLAYSSKGAKQPIHLFTIDHAVFEDRMNQKEAKAVADYIANLLENGEKSIGVVAFSQVQLEAILNKLSAKQRDQLQALSEDGSSFIRSLENVQGEECQHLIISFGYARNTEGNFNHQFGPINRDGGHRRLNVLMSRASEEISFFRSVTSSDFKLSANEGVDMVRKLMLELERLNELQASSIEREIIKISAPQKRFNAVDLISNHRVLQQRRWEIEYVV